MTVPLNPLSQIVSVGGITTPSAAPSIFDNPGNIQQFIADIRRDRFFDESNLVNFLKANLPTVKMEEDPFTYLLSLIVNGDTSIEKREKAADLFIQQNPKNRFERHFAYVTNPAVLVAHKLIESGQWKCTDSSYDPDAFWDEQLAGTFDGNIAFYKGDVLSQEEFLKLKEKLGSDEALFKPDDKGITVLTKIDGANALANPIYNVNKWYGAPVMNHYVGADSNYIPERRELQKAALEGFIKDLQPTSAATMTAFAEDVDPAALNVVGVIGPYGAGKTTFLDQKMQKGYVHFSVDKINEYLDKTKTARRQDHHFEAFVIKSDLFKALGNLPAVLQEGALIDEWRFGGFLRNNGSRHKVIVEVAALDPKESIARAMAKDLKEGLSTTSSLDAFKFRAKRIEILLKTDKAVYSLYCNRTVDNKPDFLLVAKIKHKQMEIHDEELFNKLTKGTLEQRLFADLPTFGL